jgi:hypothetical protein
MTLKLDRIVSLWLHSLNIQVSSSYLEEKLRSHPDYPSMASITGTLDELGIDNAALVVDKEKLDEVPVPFLAYDSSNAGGFVVVHNIKEQFRKDPEFAKNWNGVVVLAEKPENWRHAENESRLIKEKKLTSRIAVGLVAIVLFACIPLFGHFSWQLAGLLLSSIGGLTVAVLITRQEFGFSNDLTEQLCGLTKNTDCEAVMKSKGGKLPMGLNWADAGIIYFSSFLLLLVANQNLLIQAAISVATIPFTLFSLFYQWRVIKKWCPLCLITVTVLWIQLLLLSPSLAVFELTVIGANEMGFAVFTFITTAMTWLFVIKPALNRTKGLAEANYSLLRFKNNPEIFHALLRQQRKTDITPFENDLQLGNAQSPVQITVACNPYCAPCARAHEKLDKLAANNDIGLTIRFNIKTENKEDKRTQAVEYLLQVLSGTSTDYKREVLHDWFTWMNIEKFKEKYPLKKGIDTGDQLKRHDQWTVKTKILFTPTVFVNGHELPKLYRTDDLPGLLKESAYDDAVKETPVSETENSYALT